MISINRRIAGYYVGSFFVLQGLVWVWRMTYGSGVKYAMLRRIQMLLAIQYLMTALSTMIWNRFEYLWCSDNAGSFLNFSRGILRGLTLVFFALSHCCFSFYYVMVNLEPHWMALTCLLSYALYAHLAAFIFGSHLAEKIVDNCVLPFVPTTLSLVRRFLGDKLLHTRLAIVLAVGFTLHGFYSTGRPLTVKNVTIKLPNMHADFEGMRIALLTDVHIGPSVGRSRVSRIVDQVNALKPDIVTISGDLVDGDVAHLGNAAQPMADLVAKHGVYFATGNHEYYHGDIDEWFVFLRSINVQPLHNANRRFDIENQVCKKGSSNQPCFCMAGVDDVSASEMRVGDHHLNVSAALNGCDLTNDAVVLLCHQPKGVVQVLKDTRATNIDLILAGHTHGGQFFVIAPVAWMVNKYFLGLYHDTATDTFIYVSAGVNYWGPPVKMYGLNEITLITLRVN